MTQLTRILDDLVFDDAKETANEVVDLWNLINTACRTKAGLDPACWLFHPVGDSYVGAAGRIYLLHTCGCHSQHAEECVAFIYIYIYIYAV